MNYLQQEQKYWNQLRDELTLYKKDLQATDVELKDGLEISRQSLSLFLKRKKDTLPIGRANLMLLWDYLTDSENIKQKKISDQAIENRQKLKKIGYDHLLELAGYLPSSYSEITATTSHDLLEKNKEKRSTIRNWSEDKTFEIWLEDNLDSDKITADIELRFKEEISSICLFGESQFKDYEIDNLFRCLIEEEEKILSSNKKIALKQLSLRVSSCSFKDLSFPILDHITDGNFRREFLKASKRTEFTLRNNLGLIFLETQDEKLEIPPVIKVVIQLKPIDNTFNQVISLCHISDNTHLKNAFAAISSGMSYATKLRSRSTKIETLGDQDNCLVKVSSTLISKDTNELYKNNWVDKNTIKGIIQSTLNSARDWLADYIYDFYITQDTSEYNNTNIIGIDYPKACENYKICCAEINEIYTIIHESRKALGGYKFAGIGVVYTLREVIKKIDQISLRYKKSSFYSLYEKKIKYFKCLAYWMLTRAFHVQGNIKEAEKYLKYLEHSKEEIKDNILVDILYEVEETVFNFFSGNKIFLKNQDQWLEDQQRWIENIQKYIKEDHPEYEHFKESCNIDTYALAAEIFGRIGRLNMRFDQGDLSILDNAIENLLNAAHCCARIGHQKRLAHWLVNASMTYSRIGEGDKAQLLAELGERVIKASIEPAFNDESHQAVSDEYRQSVMAETNLAYGEKYLLIDKDFKKANEYFFKALKGSIYIGFTRVISESLYGISRSLSKLDDKEFNNFREIFKDFKEEFEDLKKQFEDQENSCEKNIIRDKIDIINFLENMEVDRDLEIISKDFEKQALNIWDEWHQAIYPDSEDARHPVSKLMEENKFLADITFLTQSATS